MKRTRKLADRLRETILNGTWVANTNYRDQLDNLDWKIATMEFKSLNTISLLAHHVHYYIAGIKNVFEGGNLEIRDKYSFQFAKIQSQNEWEIFLTKFWEDAESLAKLIEQLPDEKLDQSFVDEKYGTYQRNIDGLIEHSYYHLGQIVLLKKMLMPNN
ncbi:DUF1572 family protein [Flagellimonas nanhaiensis]|uniref:DUF1572 domain-containing protein n=1 Tax=Flagellimonas nanhaiensis TaxID=2292706 RepID=A0A371JPK5_9FLAO|nr:DUF1572 family protein [Allomuricauda nanhaiensis]RDY59386.1 DUF1572 domain-containing protein [Allomuricauda nanhaiensis]